MKEDRMRKYVSLFLAAAAMLSVPAFAAATEVGTAEFTGIVDHVSSDNIKITDVKHNKSLSFMILPKFDRVFSSDGKTTYQMRRIKPGQYVKVFYDQKALGARHADRILLLTQGNAVRGRQ
jgi:hypothetical protein